MTYTHAQLDALASNYGDCFYLYHPEKFQNNYDRFLKAFKDIYSKSAIAYSYKTNYLPNLCAEVQKRGGYAEVVSIMEYELARQLNVPAQRIIFNGPYKAPEHLNRALSEGAIVNIDAAYELEIIEAFAARNPSTRMHLGLRCNLSKETGVDSRFGIDIASLELESIIARIRALTKATLLGLHCHCMPPRRSTEEYHEIAKIMLKLVKRIFPDVPPRFVDLGGGFFSPEIPEFHSQFNLPVPNPEDYGNAIATPFLDAYPNGDGPELILEPGMALVSDTLSFVTRVLDVKTFTTGKYASVTGSIYNILPNKSKRNLPMSRVPKPIQKGTEKGPMHISGYTCMEDDIMYRDYSGDIAPGDYLIFENAGSYSIVLKPPFILPAPSILQLDKSGERAIVLRRTETTKDIFNTYTFPNSVK